MVMQTVEALIDENGTVQLLEPIRGKGKFRALLIILEEQKESDLRPYGLCEGDFVVPDNFNDPLPDEVLAGFEGDETTA
jgi:hypothetical protein